jgi:proteasome lid subunit RPN8/RPN11
MLFSSITNNDRSERRRADTILVCKSVIVQTERVLRKSGTASEAHEGVAYWAGKRLASDAIVTTCIAPLANTSYGSFETSAATNARVVMYLAKVGLELLGQVHSHPGPFIDHSEGDDERALMPYEGFFSIVVPYYSRAGMRPLTKCGVHVFRRGFFQRLTNPEVELGLRIIDDLAELNTP